LILVLPLNVRVRKPPVIVERAISPKDFNLVGLDLLLATIP